MLKKVQWENYPSHLKELLAELYESSNFSDVTILCDGNQKIKVHKVVLALYSGFFGDLFRQNEEEDVIIMPEVNYKDMVVIFDLMFTGKTSIDIDRLGFVLSLAKELQIKHFEEKMFAIQIQEAKDSLQSLQKLEDSLQSLQKLLKKPNKLFVKSEPLDESISQQNCAQTFAKGLEMTDVKHVAPNTIHPIRKENFIKAKQPIPFEEIGEVEFIKTKEHFDCKPCGKEFATKGGLQGHHKKEHLKRRFFCSACDAEFKTKDHLRVHFRVHHEGIKFGCEQCNATHATKAGLKIHIESVHEGRKWKCHICSKKFNQKGALKTHVEGQHYGKKYLCLHCHYSTGDTSNLNKHVKKMHPDIIKPKDPLDTKFRPYRPRSSNKEEPLEDRKVFMF